MTEYAKTTKTSIDKSKNELERIIKRFGAEGYVYGWRAGVVQIAFEIGNRIYNVKLPMAEPGDREFTHTPTGRIRASKSAIEHYEQEIRSRFRELVLLMKAKFIGIERGITTFDDEFLPKLKLPDGSTVGEWAERELPRIFDTHGTPEFLMPGEQKLLEGDQ